MAARKTEMIIIDDLKLLDWDDTELISAYERGLELRDDKSKDEKAQESRLTKDDGKKWSIGDYCRAIYYEDYIEYEAIILEIFDNYCCTIIFLGYDEEVVVQLSDLFESHGKSERYKQIMKARAFRYAEGSSIDTTIPSGKHRRPKSKKGRSTSCNPNDIPYQCMYDDTASKTSLHGHCGGPHCSGPSANPNFIPPAPIHQCLDAAQNSLCAMLTSWYMAGYYTGLYQGQKGEQNHQRCCYHSNQSGNHH